LPPKRHLCGDLRFARPCGGRRIDAEAYFDGLAEGMAAAKASTGIECRMIIVGVRHLGAEKVEAAARLAAAGRTR
jgi:adenosine deaminase